jgi:hypothetical protein
MTSARKAGIMLALLLLAPPLHASWTKQFRQSDQMYRVHVNHRDDRMMSTGFFLTSFPCYSMNSSDYYQTVSGKNMLTLFCLVPPEEIMISYTTKPRGTFISKSEPMTGYLRCPVVIRELMRTSVVPRLEIFIEDCAKRELNKGANAELVNRFNNTAKGTTVSEFFKGPEEEQAPQPEKQGGNAGGSIPYLEASPQ